ncbi:MAG: carboxynorspermidine decarboxylase [Methylococcaceae bacterium]|nr:MAG: carboxynorspermidine decarboxylase [Methylococcaceae bacterium]
MTGFPHPDPLPEGERSEGLGVKVAATFSVTRRTSANILPDSTFTRLNQPGLSTPAFIYDESLIAQRLAALQTVKRLCPLKVLYSVKALPFLPLLEKLRPQLDGFAVSSLFEAKLATAAGAEPAGLHITTPGLRAEDMDEIAGLCGYLSYNSLSQWRHLQPLAQNRLNAGLRVNPECSFLDDARYDPCRPHSKLGVPLSQLSARLTAGDPLLDEVQGIHFHNIFQSRHFQPLAQTLAKIEHALGGWLYRLQWINLGGGYVWDTPQELADLAEIILRLCGERRLAVFFEPGKAIVGAAGFLATRVLDVFDSGGKTLAVLDTSVNHHPEVFEYQRSPRLLNESRHGVHRVVLAGGTCLAGDVFGEYRLAALPRIGDMMVFADVGAYSLIKANRFNGHNFPSIYALDAAGKLHRQKTYTYEDYLRQWSGDAA